MNRPFHDAPVAERPTAVPVHPADGAASLRRMQAAFDEAGRRRADRTRFGLYRFAGRSVRARVAGLQLADRILGPFAHLEAERTGCSPELTIHLWDEEECGLPCPIVPETFSLGQRWETFHGMITGSADGRWIGFQYRHSMALYDRQSACLVGCRGHATHFSRYERSKPLLLFLSVWYHDRGMQLFHAGLVARNGRGLLLPGMGGSGKSTTALCCLRAGFDFLGDDFVGIEEREPGRFTGHSVYSSACLTTGHFARFPDLQPLAVQDPDQIEDKATVFLSGLFRDRLPSAVPLRAIVLPRISGQEHTRIRPARPAETLLRLAPSTIRCVVPQPGPEAMELMARLARRVPAYWLEMGRNLDGIPGGVDEILRQIPPEGGVA